MMNAPLPLLTKADRCVACGMCLPVCPTYRLSRSESDSPRGRIALLRGLLRKDLRLSAKVVSHLDGCLTCRACEAVCPANVPYGKLIDGTRAMLPMARGRPFLLRLSTTLLRAFMAAGPFWWRLASALVRIASVAPTFRRRLGLAPPAGTRLDGNPTATTVFEPTTRHRGDVALFLGCIARLADEQTLRDTIHVFRATGYRVHVPPQQRCCGALHWHQGDRRRAIKLAYQNIAAFSNLDISHVISTTTACTAMLQEYGKLQPDEPRAVTFAKTVIDVADLLMQHAELQLADLSVRVAVHTPCSARFACNQPNAGAELIGRIGDVESIALPSNTGCCGAAGANQLLRPSDADALRENTLSAIATISPAIVATTNVGCAMHLRAGLAHAGSRCDVLHPVSLIARQMRQIAPEQDQAK